MQPFQSASHRYHFDIFADYHQVYLEDCQLYDEQTESTRERPGESAEEFAARMRRVELGAARIDNLLTGEAQARHLGVAHGTLCILTARMLVVPVTVEFRDAPPPDEWSAWDFVVEASLELLSGCLIIHGPTDSSSEAPRITTAPGSYRARIHCGGIASACANGLEGDDHYLVTLWPAPIAPSRVLYADASVAW